jgi:transposase
MTSGAQEGKRIGGYLKIHVAVDIKTKEILALEVTDEKMHDGKVMGKLISRILNGHHNEKVGSVLADGAYDFNENFRFLHDKRIKPIIKVKRNSIILSKNSKVRNKDTAQQTKDFLKWKKKRRYGQRWMAETVFSSFKRMFGEHASVSRIQNMIKEMMIKVSLYNLFTRLA